MKQQDKKLAPNQDKNIETADKTPNPFTDQIKRLNAVSTKKCTGEDFDMDSAIAETEHGFNALNPTGGLQEMLAAQMLSIHRLQQFSMARALLTPNTDIEQYLTNTAVKLANCFTQQANLLARLQGCGGQKITIERVHVHQGGQAVVGSMVGSTHTEEVLK